MSKPQWSVAAAKRRNPDAFGHVGVRVKLPTGHNHTCSKCDGDIAGLSAVEAFGILYHIDCAPKKGR